MILVEGGQNITINLNQIFFFKSSRKKLLKGSYFSAKSVLKRLNNTPLMYVGAPKHFKLGKQHIFFFRSRFLKKYVFSINNSNLNISSICGAQLFSTITNNLDKTLYTDCTINRVSLEQDVILKVL